ncbi:MAG TPA: hypothetical protein H9774_01020 [Candidatus Desulfovibrio gallistercoris]|nr:hypothetical protein [Candidatus Desulfovibrio gallistercoris]
MGRRRLAQAKSEKNSAFEKITLIVGLAISISTFGMGLMAVLTGFFVLDGKLKNAEEKADVILKRIENYEKLSKEASKNVEQIGKKFQNIVIGKDFSEISIGLTDDFVDEAKNVANNEASNNVRRADAFLELSKMNYKDALYLWERVLEYDKTSSDAIYFCCLLNFTLSMESNDIRRLLESKKYLKNISEESINSIFSFVDIVFEKIDIKKFSVEEIDVYFSYIEWIYNEIGKVQESFELYYRWGYFLVDAYSKLKSPNRNIVYRAIKKFSEAEKFINENTAEKERIEYYIQYANAFISLAYADGGNTAKYWENGHTLLDPIKDINAYAKYSYAMFLYSENMFFNRFLEEDMKKSLSILEELLGTEMRSHAIESMGNIYYNMYKHGNKNIKFLISGVEYMRTTISLQNDDKEKCIAFLDSLYIIASEVNDNRKYIAQANAFFHQLNANGEMEPEFFEYKIKFMILANASEKDILSVFSDYRGAIPCAMFADQKIKNFIDMTYGKQTLENVEKKILKDK